MWIHIKELSLPPASAGDGSSQRDSMGIANDSPTLDGSCSSISTATLDSSTTNKNHIETLNEASLHVLAYAPNPIHLQVTHLQFVFLMRILDAVSEFSTLLTEDAARIQAKQESLLFAAVLPRIMVSLIVSPFPAGTPLPTSPSAISEGDASRDPASLQPLKGLIVGAVPEGIRSSPSDPSLYPSPSFSPTEEEQGEGGRLAKSQSDGCLATTAATPLPNCLEFPESANISRSGEDLKNSSTGANPGCSSRARNDRKRDEGSSRSSISSSVRRGLTSGLHSLKTTIESSVGGKLAAGADDASDTASIHSDLSNDSDSFVLLCLENEHDDASVSECAFFRSSEFPREDEVEAATEVLEDAVSSSEPSEVSSATKAKRFVSFHLYLTMFSFI